MGVVPALSDRYTGRSRDGRGPVFSECASIDSGVVAECMGDAPVVAQATSTLPSSNMDYVSPLRKALRTIRVERSAGCVHHTGQGGCLDSQAAALGHTPGSTIACRSEPQ